jgi:hypothetical protein
MALLWWFGCEEDHERQTVGLKQKRNQEMSTGLERNVVVPQASTLTQADYRNFLAMAYGLLKRIPNYLTTGEGIQCLELAHLVPDVPETVLAAYVGINDAVCNKGLVSPFLIRHGHHAVFAFDPAAWSGGAAVPPGTMDARKLLNGFEPPNATWPCDWTYVMIEDSKRTTESLWGERGYIDTIPAKFEDFTLLSDPLRSRLCVFVDERVFDHPVNAARPYLKAARDRGQKQASSFKIPNGLAGETEGLVPVILNRGEKLYIARPDFGAADHCWCNLHPESEELAVVNENSAVPLNLVIKKPSVSGKYAARLAPATGSADMTTDWFLRGTRVSRTPILQGAIKG